YRHQARRDLRDNTSGRTEPVRGHGGGRQADLGEGHVRGRAAVHPHRAAGPGRAARLPGAFLVAAEHDDQLTMKLPEQDSQTISRAPSASHRIDTRTLVETVAGQLRQEIIQGKREPGTKLSQEDLAEGVGVSRIPTRDALRQLPAGGPVTRGAFVSELTAESGAELLAIAGTLEALGVVRGAGLVTAADLEQMRKLLEEMPAYEDRPADWYYLNQEFHMVLVRASGWSRLVRMVEEARRNLVRHVVQPRTHGPQVRKWHQQHVDIYEACARGDTDKVAELFDFHWRFSTEVLLERAPHER